MGLIQMLLSVGVFGIVMAATMSYFQKHGNAHLMQAGYWLLGKAKARYLRFRYGPKAASEMTHEEFAIWFKKYTGPAFIKVTTITFLMLLAVPAFATPQANIYLADADAGTHDGSSCANARIWTWAQSAGNWGTDSTDIGIGSTVHFCGTINFPLSSTGIGILLGGTLGNPITFVWETGAKLTSPAAENFIRKDEGSTYNYIVIDGGSANKLAGNTSIENTANGKSLANQIDTFAVPLGDCDTCEVKNLTIKNLYVQVAPADSNAYGSGVRIKGCNALIHDNYMDQLYQGSDAKAIPDGCTSWKFYNNDINHMNWGVRVGLNDAAHISGVDVHGNHFGAQSNWSNFPSNPHHHDGVFITQDGYGALGGTITNTKVYGNLFDGEQGASATSRIYTNTGIFGMYAFNNIYDNTFGDGVDLNQGGGGGSAIDEDYFFLNNTMICNQSVARAIGINRVDGLTIKNNMADQQCFTYWAVGGAAEAVTNATSDYNAFDITGSSTGHAFKWDGNTGGATFAQYQLSYGMDSHSITSSDFMLNGSYIPQTGSTLEGAADNLTALCGTVPELCFDYYGNARPTVGAWDIGAVNSGSTPPPATVSTIVRLGTLMIMLLIALFIPTLRPFQEITGLKEAKITTGVVVR